MYLQDMPNIQNTIDTNKQNTINIANQNEIEQEINFEE